MGPWITIKQILGILGKSDQQISSYCVRLVFFWQVLELFRRAALDPTHFRKFICQSSVDVRLISREFN